MAKTTETNESVKQKTKLDYFVETYLLPKEDKATRQQMKARWNFRDREASENMRYFPIFKFEDVQGEGGEKITKVVDKRMSEHALFEIIKHDPTSVMNENPKDLRDITKVGGYTQWMVNLYFKLFPEDFIGYEDTRWLQVKESVRVFFEDLYRVKEDLMKFNRFKKRLPKEKHDIGQVHSTEELGQLTKDFSLEEVVATKAEVKMRILRENAKLVFEDENFEIIIPQTSEASFELAGPPLTRWCTASSQHHNYHNHYSKSGPLYIIRDKNNIVKSGKGAGDPRPIYQFHFESSQYMDVDDRRIDVVKYLAQKGNEQMKMFFKPNFLNAFNNREFDPNDQTFKNYVTLFGADEEQTKIILQFLEKKVQSSDDVVVMDENKDYSGYIDMLGYEAFLNHVLHYARPTTKVFEITFKKYQGEGIDVPEKLGTLTNINNMVLSGFVKTLPKNIGNLKKLELVAFTENPHMKGIPEPFGDIPSLQVVNVIKCNLSSANLPDKLRKAEEDGKVLVVFGN
jgi:hypothetical protein